MTHDQIIEELAAMSGHLERACDAAATAVHDPNADWHVRQDLRHLLDEVLPGLLTAGAEVSTVQASAA